MHLRDYQATTASIVADLPSDPDAPLRAWVALGSPCASVYVPVFPPFGVPAELGDTETWKRFAALRDRVEADPDALEPIRARFAPVEAELWARADARSPVTTPPRSTSSSRGAWAPGRRRAGRPRRLTSHDADAAVRSTIRRSRH